MAAQVLITFEPGLSERHKSLKACVRERIYSHPKPLKVLAADMDLSESELSRKLSDNPNDTRDFNCGDLEAYIKATGDYVPIYYLLERYEMSLVAKQALAAAEIVKYMPQLMALARQLGAVK